MSDVGFTIVKIVVQGAGKADAILEFSPGLNVVAGASNTGKTYAWQVIDFMLGASRPPKTTPFGAGYSECMIELKSRREQTLTLQRALAGGGATAYAVPINDIDEGTHSEILAERHSAKNPATISGRLLSISGLSNKYVRKNDNGVKRSLSFQDVAWLTLVDEARIIAERSPALSGEYTSGTVEKSVFGLMLTGSDDSAIIAQEAPKDRKQRIAAEVSILSSLLSDRETRFNSFAVDASQLADQQKRIAAAIEVAAGLVATRQSELDQAVAARDEAWEAIQAIRSKWLFVKEQLGRLELLQEHYAADKARLESSLEAGTFFEQLKTGECPVCGRIAGDNAELEASDQRLLEFQTACIAELGKIEILERDLVITVSAMREDGLFYDRAEKVQQAVLNRANSAISQLLEAKVASDDLPQLLAQQAKLTEAALAANEIADLRSRHSSAVQLGKSKISKEKFASKVGAAGMAEFCKTVEATLRAWKFPVDGNVSWADTEFDLVIGSENRSGMGKGYRAVTHAAFTVALMRYCRQNDLPHPGVVVIDSPLNPFKGPDKDRGDRVNTDVQAAFYADLAADASGDQIIVFENTEPPPALHSKMRYAHFSGNPDKPRVGFFPLS